MSHSKLRSEKNCLNCGAQVTGRYCNQCGQENVEPKQSLWHLIVHFFNDFTHFDGKFFSTLRLLLFRPGLLSLEHMRGRRMAYLDPIRMYLFISAVAFLVFFSFAKLPTEQRLKEVAQRTEKRDRKPGLAGKIGGALNKVADEIPEDTSFDAKTIAQYDSFQKTLPPSEQDNFIDRYLNKRTITFGEKAQEKKNTHELVLRSFDKLMHSFPQMLFLSLPLFALFLFLVNIRHRRNYYYTSHAIFTIHLYCAAFCMLILTILLAQIVHPKSIVINAMILLLLIYLLFAMKRFYRQGWLKTTIKYVIVNILSFFTVMILMIIYLVNALFSSAESL